jgi:hypothetical protein
MFNVVAAMIEVPAMDNAHAALRMMTASGRADALVASSCVAWLMDFSIRLQYDNHALLPLWVVLQCTCNSADCHLCAAAKLPLLMCNVQ